MALSGGAATVLTHKKVTEQSYERYNRLDYNLGTKNKVWKFSYYLDGKYIIDATQGIVDFWQQICPWKNDQSATNDYFGLLNSVQKDSSPAKANQANDIIENAWARIAGKEISTSFGVYVINLATQEAQQQYKVDKGVLMTIEMNVNLITNHTVLDAISAVKSN